MFLCFERDFLTCLLLFFRKSEFFCRKGVGWNEFRQPLSYYGISERNVRFWSLNSRLDNRQADNPFMAMRERYFYGVLPFSSFCRSSWRKWNRADDSPLHGKGRSSALAAWLKESPHIRIKPRVWRWMCGLSFLRHNRLYHLRLLFLVESGIVIGTANHLPLTGEPQKVVRTAEAWEECPVCVCPNKSDRHIRTHFFCGLRLVHAFKRVSKGYAVYVFMQFRILEMFHSICLLLRLPPFCDFQTAHQVVILVRPQR